MGYGSSCVIFYIYNLYKINHPMVDQQFINQLLVTYGNYLPLEHIHAIRSRLEATRHDEAMLQIIFSQLKDPTISLILSILLGPLGIDRFFIGDIGLGIGKLITGGGCSIWWIIDIFFIMDATRQKNAFKLMQLL